MLELSHVQTIVIGKLWLTDRIHNAITAEEYLKGKLIRMVRPT